MKKLFRIFYILFVFLVANSIALSTYGIIPKFSLQELTTKSKYVVIGQIADIKIRGALLTVTVIPIEFLKGNIEKKELLVKVITSSESPLFDKDETVLLFLEQFPKDPNFLTIFAGFRGKYTVEQGNVFGQRVHSIRWEPKTKQYIHQKVRFEDIGSLETVKIQIKEVVERGR